MKEFGEITEEQLVAAKQAFVHNDKSLWYEIVAASVDFMVKFALKKSIARNPEQAEELAAMATLKLLAGELNIPTKPLAMQKYLERTLTSCKVDLFRKTHPKQRCNLDLERVADPRTLDNQKLSDTETKDLCKNLMDWIEPHLTKKEMDTLQAVIVESMSQERHAEQVGIHPANIGRRLRKIRSVLNSAAEAFDNNDKFSRE